MKPKLWHHIMTGLGAALLLAATVFVLVRWSSLPEQIPSHFDAAGNPDGYGGKSGLIVLLVFFWFMYALITVCSFFPSTWNVPGKNRPNGLNATADMLAILRVLLALMLGWMLFCSALGRGLGAWFLPAVLGGMALDLGVGIFRAFRG